MQEHKFGSHKAIARISPDLFSAVFFPEGTRLLRIIEDYKNIFVNREPYILVLIEHPDLPITEEGISYPEIAPSYTQHYSGIEGEIPTVTFDGWGID